MKSSRVDSDTQKENETDSDKDTDTTPEENIAPLGEIITIQLLEEVEDESEEMEHIEQQKGYLRTHNKKSKNKDTMKRLPKVESVDGDAVACKASSDGTMNMNRRSGKGKKML